MLRRYMMITVAAFSLAGAATVWAADTVSCEGKRTWQRRIVMQTIRLWLKQQPHGENLIDLLQAEQGIAGCLRSEDVRLHSTRIPRNLTQQQLGPMLLANELEWRGVLEPPQDILTGKFFRVAVQRPAARAR